MQGKAPAASWLLVCSSRLRLRRGHPAAVYWHPSVSTGGLDDFLLMVSAAATGWRMEPCVWAQ